SPRSRSTSSASRPTSSRVLAASRARSSRPLSRRRCTKREAENATRRSPRAAPRTPEQVLVPTQVHEVEIREPRLPSAEELALSADLEIALCELEAVARLDHRLETFDRAFRQLLPGSGDEQAVRLLRAASDPSPPPVQRAEHQ